MELKSLIKKLHLSIDRTTSVQIAGLVLIYLVAAKLGLSLAEAVEQVTTVWPPTGLALAALFIFGYRLWPGVFIGALLANLLTNEPWAVAGGIAVGNTLEAVVGVYLLRRFGFHKSLKRISDVLALIVMAALASTAISATIGSFSLALGNLIEWSGYGEVWLTWWAGDLMGDLIFAPVLLVYSSAKALVPLRRRPFEAGLLFALVFATSVFVFAQSNSLLSANSFVYLIFPLIVWAALRFTQPGVVVGILTLSLVAIWGTNAGLGPFSLNGSTEQNLIFLHIFKFALTSTALLLAAAVSERQAVEQNLTLRTRELEKARNELVRDNRRRKELEKQLQEANKRITKILEGVLKVDPERRHRPR